MRKFAAAGAFVLVVAIALAGCGSSSDDETSGGTDSGGSASITLPDGWTMTDALSAEEVGAVTGLAMEVFPEASSAAQDGKPAGSYEATGVDGSKIYFGVDVQGGQPGYEDMLSYADSGSATDVSDVGDQAALVSFSDGRTGLIARKGDTVIRVDWDPKAYANAPSDFGSRLANALLAKMYE
jgi:hypothetical protein